MEDAYTTKSEMIDMCSCYSERDNMTFSVSRDGAELVMTAVCACGQLGQFLVHIALFAGLQSLCMRLHVSNHIPVSIAGGGR